ncbi:MAG: type IV secretion system DNA-binding domain-containing protein, partial [Alphaproteobacteria bacterium]
MKNIDDNQIKAEPEKSSDSWVNVLMFLSPLFVYYYFQANRLACKPSNWNVKNVIHKYWVLSIILLPINLLLAKLIVNNLLKGEWIFVIIGLSINWLLFYPASRILFSFKLSEIQRELWHGLVSPSLMTTIRWAINQHGFLKAQSYFQKLSFLIPLKSNSGTSVLGLDANAPDYRPRRERKQFPDLNLLTKYSESELITFPLARNSVEHHLVIGNTGSGKSRLLSRMALSALDQGFRVVVVDFKGGLEERDLYLSIPNLVPNKVFSSICYPGVPIDLFSGTKYEIAERILGFLPAPSGTDGAYYQSRNARAVTAVVCRTSAPPPKSAEEVLERLRHGENFAEDSLDIELFSQKEKGVSVGFLIAQSVANYLSPLMGTGGRATSGGYSFYNDIDLRVYSLDSTKQSEIRVGNAVLHDLDSYLRTESRNKDPRGILLIIDEAGALQRIGGSETVQNLISRGRSAGVSVVVA